MIKKVIVIQQPETIRSESVYWHLKNKILEGHYSPGEHLTEPNLMEEYSVSRVMIRDVLQRLVADQLVERTPYKGIRVYKMSQQEFVENAQILEVLENLAISLFMENHEEKDLLELHQIIEADALAVAQGDYFAHRKYNSEFRKAVASKSGNSTLEKMITTIIETMSINHHQLRHVFVENMHFALDSFREMLAAIEMGDLDKALDINRKQNSMTMNKYVSVASPANLPSRAKRKMPQQSTNIK